jgi:DNA-damage-inducible protein J
VEPDIKEKAEAIFETLGIPASTAINMFYRQVILWDGMPFRPSIPSGRPHARDEMTDEEFDRRMAMGLAQAKADQSAPVPEVFDRLIGEIANG